VSVLPFVSCVICAYNYERFVAEAVQSALDQDYPRDRFEVIVVDDGSTDGTPEVLRGFGDAIRVVRQENAGLNAATERGIRESRGELIALLDADDAWTPDKLRRQVELFRRPEVGLTFTDKEMVDDDGNRLHPSFFGHWGVVVEAGRPHDHLIRENFVPAPTIMFRASLRDHVLPIPPEAACQDWWLAVKVTEVADLDWIDAPLTRYRIHGENMGVGAAGAKQDALNRRDNLFRRWILRTLPLEGVRPGMLHWALRHLAAVTDLLAISSGRTHMEVLTVTAADRVEAAEHAARAEAAEAAGDLERAIRWWTAARAADPFDQRLSDRFDDAYAQHAGDAAQATVEGVPEDPAERIAWAEAAHERDDSASALDVLMDVAEHAADPRLVIEARADLGAVLFGLGNPDLARRQAAEALAADPRQPLALEVLARCSLAEGDHVQAVHWLTRATEAEPGNAELWRLLAGSCAERAHWPRAAAAWHAAAQLEPLTPGQEIALEDAERRAAASIVADAGEPPHARGRALVVVDFFYPSVGGSERLAEGVGVALRELGWSVEVACRALPERTSTRHRGMRIHQIRDNARQELRELVARRGYDAVVAFSDPQAWPVVASMRLHGPRVVAVPCVMPHNESFLRQNLDNLRSWRRLLTSIHAPVHSSSGGRDARLHADLGIDAEYVPNASEEIAPEGSLRELLGIDADMPLLLHVSNLSGQKNHLGLLAALADHPGDFRLVMVGHSVKGQDSLAREVRAAAARDPRVILAGGLPGELVAAGMREADLLVHPSISEGAPITVLEAMSCALPWIATPGCGAVHDHAGGMILPVRQFGPAIDFLLARPEAREQLGAAGRAHWEAAYTYDVIAKRYDALLRGARGLPPLAMPADALATTEAIRAEFYDATLADPAAVAGADSLALEPVQAAA
jgi:glycosyltransferase involved in cell wall biosynthesis